MGSDISSSNSYASIKVQCETDLCIGNQEFKGTVRVHVKKAFTIKSIMVEIVGVEVTRDTKKNEEKIITDYIPLDLPNRQGIVMAGTYMLPFYFKLNDAFPSSVPEFSVEGVRACIEYRCWAKLEMEGKELIGDSLVLNFVHEPKPTQPVVLNQIKAIKGWFGSDKGVSEIEVIIPKSDLYSGEQLTLNINLNNEHCSLKIKRIKCKLYEETIATEEKGNFTDQARTKYKVMKYYLPGVDAKCKASHVESIEMPTKRETRVLESIYGQYIRRTYTLVLVPVFDVVGGDGMMSVETVLTLSSYNGNKAPKPKEIPSDYQKPQPMPIQPEPPTMPPQVPIMPQEPNYYQQIPIPPQPLVSAYSMEAVPAPSNFVHSDGVHVPVGNPIEWDPNQPPANPQLYPSFEPYPPMPVQDSVQDKAKPLYPQFDCNYP